MLKTSKSQILSLQALRAIAATLVVLSHTQHLAKTWEDRYSFAPASLNSFFSLKDFGPVGVDIFFVISGFVMTYVTWNHFQKTRSWLNFLQKRFYRIAPIYWFYTVALSGVLFFVPSFFQRAQFDVSKTLLSLLFLPKDTPVGIPRYVIEVAWTLTYEVYFYILVALLLFLNRKYFLPILIAWFGIWVSLRSSVADIHPIFETLTSSLLFEFVLGVNIGFVYCKKIKVPNVLSILLVLAAITSYGLWIFSPFGWDRFFEWGLPSGALVAGCIFLDRAKKLTPPRWLASLGDSSYSLYLTHVLVLPIYGKIFVASHLQNLLGPNLFIVLGVLFAIVAGHVLYLVIEKPLIQKLSRK